jgi:hypothetical protein
MDLGDLPGGSDHSIAYGINNNHQVVGTGYSSLGQEAFIWESASGMVSLNAQLDNGAGWTLREARAINSFGLIAAWGTNPQGGTEAVLLTPNGPPAIGYTPAGLNFVVNEGAVNSPSQNLLISNTGGGTMYVVAGGGNSWVQVPGNGATLGPGQTMTVPVSVFAMGQLPGTYSGSVVVSSTQAANSPQWVPVTMTVNPYPKIGYSPTSFTFAAVQGAGSPPSQTLSISNAQSGTLNWTVSDSATWLTLAPTSGQQSGVVTLSVNSAGLTAGTYFANITIVGNAIISPVTVQVTLNVSAPLPATIGFSPASNSRSPTPAREPCSGGWHGPPGSVSCLAAAPSPAAHTRTLTCLPMPRAKCRAPIPAP